ncbi:MAG: helix-turn-helix transcriptional regulator [Janthinobacterium lividum]
MPAQSQSEFLTVAQYCELTQINPKTSQRQRLRGDGPPFVRFGSRTVLYRRSDVDAYLAKRTFKHRAEEATAPQAA